MAQMLFVLHDGRISQWSLSHGKLATVTVLGQRRVLYSAESAKTYWEEWKKDNRVVDGDDYDVLFLSDDEELLGSFPTNLTSAHDVPLSKWTLKQLSLLSRESDFADSDIHVIQGSLRHTFKSASHAKALSFHVRSSYDFSLEQKIFFLLLEKNHFSIFEEESGRFKLRPIDKATCVRYQAGCFKDALLQAEKWLRQKCGLSPDGGFLMVLVENEDATINEIANRTGKFLLSIPLPPILGRVQERLTQRTELRMDEFGMNFDCFCCLSCNGEIKKSPFNLCSYTVTGEDLFKYGGDAISEIAARELLF